MKKISVYVGLLFIAFLLVFNMQVAFADRYFYDNTWHEYNAPPIYLYVNGREITPDVPPIIINDRTLVPIRFITQALGGEITWDESTYTVGVKLEKNTLVLKIDSHQAVLNGKTIEMNRQDPPPKIVNDRTMVPIRFVSENMGYHVSFDDNLRQVHINKEAPSQADGGGQASPTPKEEKPVENGNDDGNENEEKIEKAGITKIEYEELEYGDRIIIHTSLKQSPKVLKLKEPNRLVFDFPNAYLTFKNGTLIDEGLLVKNIRYATHDTFSRIAMDVEDYPSYVIKSQKNKIIIDILDGFFKISYDGLSNKALSFDGKFKVTAGEYEDGIYTAKINSTSFGNGGIEINDGYIERITLESDRKNKETTLKIYTKCELFFDICVSSTTEIAFFTADEAFEDEEYIMEDKFIRNDIVIVLDPGHGGIDPGASGVNPDGTKVYEKDINLDITQKTGKFLKDAGAEVILTPVSKLSNKEKLELPQRVEISNNTAPTVFISIHCNAVEKNGESVSGTMVFYKPDSQSVEAGSGVFVNPKEISQYILDSIVENTGLNDNKIRDGGTLYVIRNNNYPAVLIECAFLTNPGDLEKLNDEDFRTLLAKSIAEGVIKYINKISD